MDDLKSKAKMNVLRELLNYGDDDLEEKLKPKATVIEIGIGKPEMGKGMGKEMPEMEEEKSEMIDEDSDDFEPSSELSDEEKEAIEKIRKKYLVEKK